MYRILAIDGGGSRGIIPATLLHCLHQDTGIHPLEHFDLVAGTSTGGIISIALAAGITPAQLVDLYLTKVDQIFSESWLDKLSGMDEHLQANYSNKKLKKILEQLLGRKTLKDLHQSANFGKKGKTLMVCAFDLYPLAKDPKTPDFNYRPHVFNSAYLRDGAETLVDLALRTSAGPTYFPIYQHFIDGGVAMNNPSMAALAFAMNDSVSSKPHYLYEQPTKKGPGITDRRKIRLLSLGCGTSNSSFISPDEITKRKRGNWGNLQWIKYLPDLLTESNMQSSWYYVQQVLHDNHYHRINVRFTDAIHYPDLLHKVISMDEKDPATLQAMHEFAKDTYEQQKGAIFKLLGIK
jgi:patatin-like phospholipase/acyl hydrolase